MQTNSTTNPLPAAALPIPAVSGATTWDIDATHSNVGFGVRHLMVSTVRGEFTKYTGTVTLDDQDVTKSKVEANIDLASVSTREPKRDDHLKSPDFFDVAKFPSMTFKSTKVAAAGDGLQVTGDLTLHGVTKEVVLAVETPTQEVKDLYGNVKRGVSATATINRKDFGLKWNAALDGGGVVVGENVKISLELELTKQVAAPAKK